MALTLDELNATTQDDWEPGGEWNVNGAAAGGGAQGGNGGRLTTI